MRTLTLEGAAVAKESRSRSLGGSASFFARLRKFMVSGMYPWMANLRTPIALQRGTKQKLNDLFDDLAVELSESLVTAQVRVG